MNEEELNDQEDQSQENQQRNPQQGDITGQNRDVQNAAGRVGNAGKRAAGKINDLRTYLQAKKKAQQAQAAAEAAGKIAQVATKVPNPATPYAIIALIVVGVILIITLIAMLIMEEGGMIGGVTGKGGSTPSAGLSSNISTCKFMREGDPVKEDNFKSKLLLSYFSEAEKLSGIPAVVLAAITRVESGSSLDYTDENLNTFANNCPENPTSKAIGIMQIIPPWGQKDAYCEDCVNIGAGFLGKTAKDLTRDDFCDPRKGILLSAGFILKKMQYAYGESEKTWKPEWTNSEEAIKKMVEGYYGSCIKYGDDKLPCDKKPFDYGKDVWTSIQNCKNAAPVNIPKVGFSCPLPGKRVIGCASFMSDAKFNRKDCLGTKPEDNGHCGLKYGCFRSDKTQITNPSEISNMRRAHSIDVDANADEEVTLPYINGQSVTWISRPELSYGRLDDKDGGGFGNVFVADFDGNKYTIHFVHTTRSLIPPPGGRNYISGDRVTKIYTNGEAGFYTHLHVNIGINNKLPDGGEGWINPEDLRMCVEQ